MRLLVAPVSVDEALQLALVGRVGSELRRQGRADASDPGFRAWSRRRPTLECVPHRLQQQLDAVDERSVEIEEHRTRRHGIRPGWVLPGLGTAGIGYCPACGATRM